MSNVTCILSAIEQGDLHAAEQLLGHSTGSRPMAPVEGQAIGEGPGTILGPYKLLEQIGEGGFGVVFMAEQLEPIRRRVALKVLKPGMDTKQVIGRFEAVRQALALMDHQNIAHVHDAGATATPLPARVRLFAKVLGPPRRWIRNG
jgi:serine/threonine protein kinase